MLKKRVLVSLFVCVFALLAATPLFAVDTYTGTPYGGVNLNANKAIADALYPPQVRAFFDDAPAMQAEDVKKFDTPMISGTGGGVGVLKPGHGSMVHGEIGWSSSTTEIINFINALPKTYMRTRIVASFPDYNNDGTFADIWHDMILAVFSSDGSVLTPEEAAATGKPVIWMQAQIHGNENSATEGALELARRLANGEFNDVLDKFIVCVLPRWNLDGARRYTRGTNILTSRNSQLANMDQNRDHMVLQSYFTKQVHKMVVAFDPVICLDMHEMGYTNGAGQMWGDRSNTTYWEYQLHDIATLPGMNPNIPLRARNLAFDVFQKGIENTLESKGFYWHFYDEGIAYEDLPRAAALSSDLKTVVQGDFKARLKTGTCEGTSDEGVGRPNFGFLPALSFLSESRSPKFMPSMLRRSYTHYLTAAAILWTARDNADALKEMKEKGREEMIANNALLLRLKFPAVKEQWPAAVWKSDFSALEASSREITVWRSRYAYADPEIPGSAVIKPTAYVLPNTEILGKIAGKWMNNGVKLERLERDTQMQVEVYNVTEIASGIGFKLEGRDAVKTMGGIGTNLGIQGVTKSTKTITVPKDSYIMYTNQSPATNAALMVEPMAMRNVANYYYVNADPAFAEYCKEEGFFQVGEGDEYPVYRYTKNEALPTYSVPGDMPPDIVDGIFVEIMVPTKSEMDAISLALDRDAAPDYLSNFRMLMPLQNASGITVHAPVDTDEYDCYVRSASGGTWTQVTADANGMIEISASNIGSDGEVYFVAYKEGVTPPGPIDDGGSSSGCNAGAGILLLVVVAGGMAARRRMR